MDNLSGIPLREVITWIVTSNPVEVKRLLKQITGINFDKYTNTQLVNYLTTMSEQGYNTSFLADIKPVNAVQVKDNTGKTYTVGGAPPKDAKGGWETWGLILAAVGGAISSVTAVGNAMFNQQNPTLPSTPPSAPKTKWDAFKEWMTANPVMAVGGFLTICALVYLAYIGYKKRK